MEENKTLTFFKENHNPLKDGKEEEVIIFNNVRILISKGKYISYMFTHMTHLVCFTRNSDNKKKLA